MLKHSIHTRLILQTLIALGSLWPMLSQAAIHTEEISYSDGATTLKGYLAYDDASKTPRPGVLVVHEWWGHNDYARKRAKMLAEMGYVALALDMYGDGKQAAHPDEAGKFSGEIAQNSALGKTRFLAALETLKKQPQTDAKRIAAIGYCFGGGVVLQMAREGVDLAGVASFHGSLGTTRPAEAGKVKAQIAVYYGESDPFSPKEEVEKFKAEMSQAQVNVRYKAYPNVLHSFTNPDADSYGEKFKMPLRYNAEADKDSWADLKSFLGSVFSSKTPVNMHHHH